MQVKGTWCLRPFGRSGSMPKRKRKLRKDCLQKTEGEGSHGRMARGGHGLPKVATGPAMPNSFMTWGRATIETALQPFQGRPAAIFYPFRHPTPYAYEGSSEENLPPNDVSSFDSQIIRKKPCDVAWVILISVSARSSLGASFGCACAMWS
jgi:hypothetical protein